MINVGAIINKKVGRKLQRVKTLQRYYRVKITPILEADKLDMWDG